MDTPRLSRRRVLVGLGGCPLAGSAVAQAFDHDHAAWTALLRRHLRLADGAVASQLRYAGVAAERDRLTACLDALASVPRSAFDGWSKPQQMAFLINGYNAFTVALVLTRYPKLESIKDLGGLLSTPWKPKFIALLGTSLSLDDIEHGMLRARGRYDDPRLHFALNCASIGCPMLREEAYVAARLDAQLDEQARRFLSDRSRNRYHAATGRLEVSKIFDWYGDDFKAGHRGIDSLAGFLARHADQLADTPAGRDAVRTGRAPIAFLDYDWKLNDAR